MTSPDSVMIPWRACNTTTTILGSGRLPDSCGRCGAPYKPAIAAFGRPRPTLGGPGFDRRPSTRLVP